MKLHDLLQSAGLRADPTLAGDVLATEITRVTADSREVGPGTLFVAVRGGSADGHAFVEQAIAAGAVAIVGEEPWAWGAVRTDERYLSVPSSRQALGDLASAFHGHPSRSMLMVGVTGTSGKTTITYLIESILRAAGRRTGLIGTVNFRFEGTVLPSTHTTPGAPELQGLLARMRDLGADAVVMEVSSHALKQRRVAGTAFDGMVFTNLSPEHLDFHPDMDDYYASKKLLFTEMAEAAWRGGKRPRAAINADDAYGARLLRELGADPGRGVEFVPFSAQPPATDSRMGVEGIAGKVEGVDLRSPLIGGFNVSNLAAAVAVTRELGIPLAAIAEGAAALPVVPGRLQRVADPRGVVHVLVDYAHKPDALEKVLRTLGEMREGGRRLITVFGCGGDRDRTKRPVMGRIAVTLSDRVFITSDNPRTEDPAAIVAEIVAGTEGARNFEVEVDRRRAIFRAVAEARPGDLVVIAGKGHEDYQIVRDPQAPAGAKVTVKVHFDDREVAAEALAARKD
jgi:UDP-N-acetylmuramoyl-L-alanyl-D-glutamate--2,6-diaminopimelate ligase